MRITKELLIEKGACVDGIKWFEKHFPALDADYQSVLNELAKHNKSSYAEWMLQNIGATNDVLEIEEIITENSLFFAGEIKVIGKIKVGFSIKAGRGIKAGDGIEAGRGIEAGDGIKAGWSIKAGDGIEAGRGIEAGDGIKAGRGIEAGDGYGIFAGLNIKINDWHVYAKVSAETKPKNLISGAWKDE